MYYVAMLTVAVLAIGICMRYLAISGEDLGKHLLVCDNPGRQKLVCCSLRLAPW